MVIRISLVAKWSKSRKSHKSIGHQCQGSMLEAGFTLYHTPFSTAAAAVKLLQSCPTLCDPIDGSPRGPPVPGILQARTLEWVAISFSNAWKWKVKGKSLSPVQLCDPMDYSPWGSSVRGILQARILEWVAFSFSRGSSWPRDRTQVSCIAGGFFTIWAIGILMLSDVKVYKGC